MAAILPALVAVMGCGRVVGIHDFSPADAGSNVDGPWTDVVRDLRMDVEVADTRTSPDTSDADTVLHFAIQVGSPDILQMLFVLTAADLGAVGPDVWDGWKAEILTDLYHRTMQQLRATEQQSHPELFRAKPPLAHPLSCS